MDWVSVLAQNSETVAILLVGVAYFARQALQAGGDRLHAAADMAAAEAAERQNEVDREWVEDKLQLKMQDMVLSFTQRMEERYDKVMDVVLQQNQQLLNQSKAISERNEVIAELKRDRVNYRVTMDNQLERIDALEKEKAVMAQDYNERLNQLETEVAQWRKDYNELAQKLKERDTEIAELYERLETKNRQLETALEELEIERAARLTAERERDALRKQADKNRSGDASGDAADDDI
jgi:chromosome segregation ATPase